MNIGGPNALVALWKGAKVIYVACGHQRTVPLKQAPSLPWDATVRAAANRKILSHFTSNGAGSAIVLIPRNTVNFGPWPSDIGPPPLGRQRSTGQGQGTGRPTEATALAQLSSTRSRATRPPGFHRCLFSPVVAQEVSFTHHPGCQDDSYLMPVLLDGHAPSHGSVDVADIVEGARLGV